MDVLDGILNRIESGMTTMGDAVALRLIIDEMRQDIAKLTAVIEKEINYEPKPEQKPRARQFDGAGTA